jgi:hypothetical protein
MEHDLPESLDQQTWTNKEGQEATGALGEQLLQPYSKILKAAP